MKLRHKILSLVIAIVLLVPTMMLVACGGNSVQYAWGKTFRYSGSMRSNKDEYNININGVKGSTRIELLRAQYSDNLNLEAAQVNNIDQSLANIKGTSFEQFFNNLQTLADNYFSNLYRNFDISVGTIDEKKITIAGIEYSLQQSNNVDVVYDIIDSANPASPKVGSVITELSNDSNGKPVLELTPNKDILLGGAEYKFCIYIPTITPITDPTATQNINENGDIVTAVTIEFVPHFNVVTE